MRHLLVLAVVATFLTPVGPPADARTAGPTVMVDRGHRTLKGPRTGLTAVQDVDSIGGYTYVLQADAVRLFRAYATGDTAPKAAIAGDFGAAVALTVGDDGTVYVLETDHATFTTVAVYVRTDGTYGAPSSYAAGDLGLSSVTDLAAVGHDVALLDTSAQQVVIDDLTSATPATPLRVIGPGHPALAGSTALAATPGGRVAVGGTGYVVTFGPHASGASAPLASSIAGGDTGIGVATSVGIDRGRAVYVMNQPQTTPGPTAREAVLMWRHGQNHDAEPTAVLTGAHTGFGAADRLDVAPNRSLMTLNFDDGVAHAKVSVFRGLGPYRVPGRIEGLRVAGAADAATRTISWRRAATDPDVPVGTYDVRVDCRGRKVDRLLGGRARKVTVKRARLAPGRCSVRISAVNQIGRGKPASATFTVGR